MLELGCGISPLNGLTTRDLVRKWVLTDQVYVRKLVERNILANEEASHSGKGKKTSSGGGKGKGKGKEKTTGDEDGTVVFQVLDWETDEITSGLTGLENTKSFDAVVACDCIYNYALVEPLVQACADACELREQDEIHPQPCICVVAQQLRSDDVFETWLTAFNEKFHVYRVPDSKVVEGLRSIDGFTIHIGVLMGVVRQEN